MSAVHVSELIFCFLLLGLLFVTVQGHTTACNHGNDQTCLYGNATFSGVRHLMNNSNYFWFGTKYDENCPTGDPKRLTVECFNPAPTLPSIIERLRFTNDSDTSNIEQYLRVHYGVPEGEYKACHSRISVPVTDKNIDPVHTIYNDAWALNHRPHVMWQKVCDGCKTTLVFWEAGWFQLQGMFINNAGEKLRDGTVVIPYTGPMNPIPRKNPLLIALFNQTQTLTVQQAYSAVKELSTPTPMGTHMVNMNELMTRLGLEGPVGVSIVRTSVTPYSAQYGRDKNIINSCPYLRTAVMKQDKDTLPWNTTATPLSVTVEVGYHSQPLTYTSCCQQHSTRMEMMDVDSRAPEPIDAVHLRMAPSYVRLVPTAIRDDPYYFSHPGRKFTLLMLDMTDSAHNVTDQARLHWQVINIHDPGMATGTTTVPYKPPHEALASSEERRFAFLLLEQSEGVLLTAQTASYTDSSCQPASQRCVFDLTRFMSERNVKIVGMSLLRAKRDHYSRMHAYTHQGSSKTQACAGVSGFADPCPTTTCEGTAVLSLPSLLTLGLLLSLGL